MQIVKQIKAIFQIFYGFYPKYAGSHWTENLPGDKIATTRKCVNSLEFFLK